MSVSCTHCVETTREKFVASIALDNELRIATNFSVLTGLWFSINGEKNVSCK